MGYAFINALSKSLVSGQDHFSSPGIRFKSAAAILVVVQRLYSYNTCSCDRTSSPGYYTCRETLSWLAVKAGECSCWPGKLIFTGVINRIFLLTLAGEFSNLLLLLRWAYSNKKWKIITLLYEKVKNHYFFVLKSEKSLPFCIEKWQIFTYMYVK